MTEQYDSNQIFRSALLHLMDQVDEFLEVPKNDQSNLIIKLRHLSRASVSLQTHFLYRKTTNEDMDFCVSLSCLIVSCVEYVDDCFHDRIQNHQKEVITRNLEEIGSFTVQKNMNEKG